MAELETALFPIVAKINEYLSNYILVFLLIGVGLWYSIQTRFVQVRCFGEGMKKTFGNLSLRGGRQEQGMSSFQALATAIAAQVGTGNIVGASGAILSGGPGAIFWMWIIAFFGMATIYAEATLAIRTRQADSDGSYRGGPVYYITTAFQGGFGKFLAGFFAVAIILALGFMGCMVQSNSIGSTFETAFGIPAWTVGIALVVICGIIFLGGVQRLASVTEKVVPIMAAIFLAGGLVVLIARIQYIPATFGMIFQYAFQPQAIIGGSFGYALKTAISQGAKRGLFSNEAGMGSAPNAAATASVSHPVKQGLVQSLSVYIDTLLICTCSAMMVMIFWVQDPALAASLNGMPLVQMAVNNSIGEIGIHFITFAIFAFAFSSLIGNYFYAETNFRYIFKHTKWGMVVFRVLCLAAIFYGCVNSFDLAWNLADIFMGFMAIINLVAILLLGKWALAALDDYTRQRKAGKDPVFLAANVPGMPACECWTTEDLPTFGENPVEEYIEEAANFDVEGLK